MRPACGASATRSTSETALPGRPRKIDAHASLLTESSERAGSGVTSTALSRYLFCALSVIRIPRRPTQTQHHLRAFVETGESLGGELRIAIGAAQAAVSLIEVKAHRQPFVFSINQHELCALSYCHLLQRHARAHREVDVARQRREVACRLT
jgi:hypothetical protein